MADCEQGGPLEWQSAYRAALCETDSARLKEKIHAAETALYNRAQQLNTPQNDPERLAMRDAAHALRVLMVKELGYPAVPK